MSNFRTNDVDSNTYARFPVETKLNVVEFSSTNWSTPYVIAEASSGASFGYTINSLYVSSTDTVSNNLIFILQKLNETPISTPVAFCPVAIGAGTDFLESSVAILDSDTIAALTRVDNNGNSYISMDLDWKLLVKLRAAPTASKTIAVISLCNMY